MSHYTHLSIEEREKLDRLNFRPRKCLDWKTPFEIYFDKLLHLT